MEKFIGVKIIKAVPMTYQDFNRNVRVIEPATVETDGYLVEYADGYQSWSPKSVFEEAYRKTNGMTFGLALEALKKGHGVRLPSWSEDVIIKAQFPDENSKMTAPYLYVVSRYGMVPWKETMIELFSDEWEIFE